MLDRTNVGQEKYQVSDMTSIRHNKYQVSDRTSTRTPQTDRQSDRSSTKQTNKQTNKQIDIQTDRKTDRQSTKPYWHTTRQRTIRSIITHRLGSTVYRLWPSSCTPIIITSYPALLGCTTCWRLALSVIGVLSPDASKLAIVLSLLFQLYEPESVHFCLRNRPNICDTHARTHSITRSLTHARTGGNDKSLHIFLQRYYRQNTPPPH